MAWVLPSLMRKMADFLRFFIEMPHTYALDEGGVQSLLYQTLGQVFMAVGIVFFLMALAGIIGVMAQTGFFLSLDLLVPDLARLSPMRGLKRLFSPTAAFELGKSLGKMVFIGGVAYAVLFPIAVEVLHLTGLPLESRLAFLHDRVVHLIIMMALAFTLVAIVDMFFTRVQFIKGLRMSKEEIRDEFKQQEGDPTVKSRLRQIRIEKARKRMMAQVPNADVVITNPTHYAVALKYDGGKMTAPVMLAKGLNLIAERIREIAEENRIPLVSNPPLARALYDTVEIDQQIPTQFYRAVAEVISYVYKLKKKGP